MERLWRHSRNEAMQLKAVLWLRPILGLVILGLAIVAACLQNLGFVAWELKAAARWPIFLFFFGVFITELLFLFVFYEWASRFGNLRELAIFGLSALTLFLFQFLSPANDLAIHRRLGNSPPAADRIRIDRVAVERLGSVDGRIRIAVRFAAMFSNPGSYIPVVGVDPANRSEIQAAFFKKTHPEYFEYGHTFLPDLPYDFIAVIEGNPKVLDLNNAKARIDFRPPQGDKGAVQSFDVPLAEAANAMSRAPRSGTGLARNAELASLEDDLKFSHVRALPPSRAASGPAPLEFTYEISNIGARSIAKAELGRFLRIGCRLRRGRGPEPAPNGDSPGRPTSGGAFVIEQDLHPELSAPDNIGPGASIVVRGEMGGPSKNLQPGEYELEIRISSRFATFEAYDGFASDEPLQVTTGRFSLFER